MSNARFDSSLPYKALFTALQLGGQFYLFTTYAYSAYAYSANTAKSMLQHNPELNQSIHWVDKDDSCSNFVTDGMWNKHNIWILTCAYIISGIVLNNLATLSSCILLTFRRSTPIARITHTAFEEATNLLGFAVGLTALIRQHFTEDEAKSVAETYATNQTEVCNIRDPANQDFSYQIPAFSIVMASCLLANTLFLLHEIRNYRRQHGYEDMSQPTNTQPKQSNRICRFFGKLCGTTDTEINTQSAPTPSINHADAS